MQIARGGAQLTFEVTDLGHVGTCRRAAQKLAEVLRLDATSVAQASVVASEMATNVVKHGKGGELLLQPIDSQGHPYIEILAIDNGPGMWRVDECMRDGYSTGGTAGTGLGAVRRMSTVFDIYSRPNKGTVVLAHVGGAGAPQSPSVRQTVQCGMICLPVHGETECGDTWSVAIDGPASSLLIVDGLGHGPLAAVAATEAAVVHAERPFDPPQETMRALHRRLAGTRGAAAACAVLDVDAGSIQYSGVGNIAGRIVSSGLQKGLLSHNGTLGLILSRSQSIHYDWPPGALLVMHSDGLSSRWALGDYPGLVECHPSIIASLLHRDFSRGRDDSTIVVVRHLQ